jgi:hypothetical protein
MNRYFPTFNEFRNFSNKWREPQEKEPRSNFTLILMYPFALMAIFFLYVIFFAIIKSINAITTQKYTFDKKYRKVIKKGWLWDSVEYHER